MVINILRKPDTVKDGMRERNEMEKGNTWKTKRRGQKIGKVAHTVVAIVDKHELLFRKMHLNSLFCLRLLLLTRLLAHSFSHPFYYAVTQAYFAKRRVDVSNFKLCSNTKQLESKRVYIIQSFCTR